MIAITNGKVMTITHGTFEPGTVLVEGGRLTAAVASQISDGSAALLIVPVGDAYISPGWYPSKADDPKVVPTWNYEVVHLHGRLSTHDEAWTEQLVRDLTDHHEAAMPSPWSVDDAPPEYVARMLKAIVGVSLEVTGIEAKRKLSQNKSPAMIGLGMSTMHPPLETSAVTASMAISYRWLALPLRITSLA